MTARFDGATTGARTAGVVLAGGAKGQGSGDTKMSDDNKVEAQASVVAAPEVKIRKRDKAGRLTEAWLRSEYPHVVEGSLSYDSAADKQRVKILCVDCGEEREVYSSDLFQISRCEECTKIARKARKAEKKAEAKAALAAAEAAKAKAVAAPVEVA